MDSRASGRPVADGRPVRAARLPDLSPANRVRDGGGGDEARRLTHVPLRNDADPLWREIHAAADEQYATLNALLYAAFVGLVTRTVLLRLRSALRIGDVEAALQAVPVSTLLTLRPAIEELLAEVARQGATVEQSATVFVRLGSSQGLPVAETAFWARQHSAGLVVGITEQTRLALRRVIADAIAAGRSPAVAAKVIEAVIGLNTVQAGAVWRLAQELLGDGVDAGRMGARIARYAAQLLKQRARVISRHELLLAANAGRRAQWSQNVRDGLIAPDRWEREWAAIVPSDGRTCPVCEELDGQRAPINGTYPDGRVGPPAHVLCRCTEVLVRKAAV